jgi:hypothetical protein
VQQIERDGVQRCQTDVHIYTTLKFLALQGAPYIYDISRLRVKLGMPQTKHKWTKLITNSAVTCRERWKTTKVLQAENLSLAKRKFIR